MVCSAEGPEEHGMDEEVEPVERQWLMKELMA